MSVLIQIFLIVTIIIYAAVCYFSQRVISAVGLHWCEGCFNCSRCSVSLSKGTQYGALYNIYVYKY